NDQHRLLTALDLLEQKLVDDRQSIEAIQAIDRQPELDCDSFHQFIRAHHWIENERRCIVAIQLLEHRPAEGRLAGADLARQLDEAFALTNSVEQMVDGLSVFGAVEEEPRVRRDVERRFAQAIVVQIHDSLLAKTEPEGRKSFVGLISASVLKHDRKPEEEAPSSKLQRNIKSQAQTESGVGSFRFLALGGSLELGAWMLVPRGTVSLMHDGSRCLHQRLDIGARADRDSQVTPQHWVIEPPHQYLSLPQFF